MKQSTLLLASLFLPLVSPCAEPKPAIAVSIESTGLVAPGTDARPHYLAAVWSDGRIVWSRDQQAGGAPYLTARLEPSRVQS